MSFHTSTDMAALPQQPRRPRKKKACQRCRYRKQRCDGQLPTCRNCRDAQLECLPATHEVSEMFPVDYVRSLERRAAALEHRLNDRISASTQDCLNMQAFPAAEAQDYGFSLGTSGFVETLQWDPLFSALNTPVAPEYSNDALISEDAQGDIQLQDSTHVEDEMQRLNRSEHLTSTAASVTSTLWDRASPFMTRTAGKRKVTETSTNEAEFYFQTYFQVIHPRYAFLDVQECIDAFTCWKRSVETGETLITGWSAFLVRMIFAVASLLQRPKLDHCTKRQHLDFFAQAEAEHRSSADFKRPLVRVQAMLLHAIYALHGESTSRIVQISGILMRYASLHGFHRLVDDGRKETALKIRAWSSIYLIDRIISMVLDIPTALSDEWITSPLYDYHPESSFALPWFPNQTEAIKHKNLDLGVFAHMCQIRHIQSKIMARSCLLSTEDIPAYISEMHSEIDAWLGCDRIYSYSQLDEEGLLQLSPGYMRHMAQITRVLVHHRIRSNGMPVITEQLLQETCKASGTFRTVQKRKQIAEFWVDIVLQFQFGVMVLYISWKSKASPTSEVDRALRDCTAWLAVVADRSQTAVHYHDCIDVLDAAICRGRPGQTLEGDSKAEIEGLIAKVEEIGVAPHISRMLWEMVGGRSTEDDVAMKS